MSSYGVQAIRRLPMKSWQRILSITRTPNQVPGPAGVKEAVKAFREGFPDAQITIEQMIAEGDTVAFRFVLQGTHLSTFAGFPPTGKEAVLTGVDFIRLAEGKMIELWSTQDTFSWAQQLGYKISR